eukprot:SAG11_NODE_2517_length_3265_cov_1.739419_4_plen_69_part_00
MAAETEVGAWLGTCNVPATRAAEYQRIFAEQGALTVTDIAGVDSGLTEQHLKELGVLKVVDRSKIWTG